MSPCLASSIQHGPEDGGWTASTPPDSALRKHTLKKTGSLFILMINVYTRYIEKHIFPALSWHSDAMTTDPAVVSPTSRLEYFFKPCSTHQGIICVCEWICFSSLSSDAAALRCVFLESAAEKPNCDSPPMSILILWLCPGSGYVWIIVVYSVIFRLKQIYEKFVIKVSAQVENEVETCLFCRLVMCCILFTSGNKRETMIMQKTS